VRVSHVTWPAMGLDYGWRFDIRSEDELNAYWKARRPKQVRAAFAEVKRYQDANKVGPSEMSTDGPSHFVNGLAAVYCYHGMAHEQSLFESACRVDDGIIKSMLDCIQKHGHVYIHHNGSYFAHMQGLELLETHMVKGFELPECNKIEVTQWPRGIHYYAKVDGVEVNVRGENKWLSKFSAEQAAKEWIKQKAGRNP